MADRKTVGVLKTEETAVPAGEAVLGAPTRKENAPFVAREAIYTGERVTLTPQQTSARKRRSLWLALALVSFVVLVFVITITRLGANALETGL